MESQKSPNTPSPMSILPCSGNEAVPSQHHGEVPSTDTSRPYSENLRSEKSLQCAQARGIRAWLGADQRSSLPVFYDGAKKEPEIPWLLLNEGDRVEVHGHGPVLVGTVDCVMADGSIFWMWQDLGAGRIAVYEDDDVVVKFI